MPIRAEMRDKYPPNWAEISSRVRDLADQKCEFCGISNHAWGHRDREGRFHETGRSGFPKDYGRPPFQFGGVRIIEIVLTTAHLNHDPSDCRLENLKALCQRCHLRYDAAHHQRTRAETMRKRMATPDMFTT